MRLTEEEIDALKALLLNKKIESSHLRQLSFKRIKQLILDEQQRDLVEKLSTELDEGKTKFAENTYFLPYYHRYVRTFTFVLCMPPATLQTQRETMILKSQRRYDT